MVAPDDNTNLTRQKFFDDGESFVRPCDQQKYVLFSSQTKEEGNICVLVGL